MSEEQREMIEAAELDRVQSEMEGTAVDWSDYPFDPSEESNFSDFPQEYRSFDGEDRDLYQF